MLIGAAAFASPGPAEAQFLKKIKDAAENAAERETANQVDRLVTNAIRCAVDDPVCIERAEASGEDVAARTRRSSGGNVARSFPSSGR